MVSYRMVWGSAHALSPSATRPTGESRGPREGWRGVRHPARPFVPGTVLLSLLQSQLAPSVEDFIIRTKQNREGTGGGDSTRFTVR